MSVVTYFIVLLLISVPVVYEFTKNSTEITVKAVETNNKSYASSTEPTSETTEKDMPIPSSTSSAKTLVKSEPGEIKQVIRKVSPVLLRLMTKPISTESVRIPVRNKKEAISAIQSLAKSYESEPDDVLEKISAEPFNIVAKRNSIENVQVPEVISTLQPVAESYVSDPKEEVHVLENVSAEPLSDVAKPITVESIKMSNITTIIEPDAETRLHVTSPITEAVLGSEKETDAVVHTKPDHKMRWNRIKFSPNFSTAKFKKILNGSPLRHVSQSAKPISTESVRIKKEAISNIQSLAKSFESGPNDVLEKVSAVPITIVAKPTSIESVQIPDVLNIMQPAESYVSDSKEKVHVLENVSAGPLSGVAKPIKMESVMSNVTNVVEPEIEAQLHVTSPITEKVSHSKSISFQSASKKETDDVVHIKPHHKIRWKRIKPSPNFSTAEFQTKLNGSPLKHIFQNAKPISTESVRNEKKSINTIQSLAKSYESKPDIHVLEKVSAIPFTIVAKPNSVETIQIPEVINRMQPVAESYVSAPKKEVRVLENVSGGPLSGVAKPITIRSVMSNVTNVVEPEIETQLHLTSPITEEVSHSKSVSFQSASEKDIGAVVNIKPHHKIRWKRIKPSPNLSSAEFQSKLNGSPFRHVTQKAKPISTESVRNEKKSINTIQSLVKSYESKPDIHVLEKVSAIPFTIVAKPNSVETIQIPEVINRMQAVAKSYVSAPKEEVRVLENVSGGPSSGVAKPINIESVMSNVIEPEIEAQLHVTSPITEEVSHSESVSFQSASEKEIGAVANIKPPHKIRWKRIKPSPNFSSAEFQTKLNRSPLRHVTQKAKPISTESVRNEKKSINTIQSLAKSYESKPDVHVLEKNSAVPFTIVAKPNSVETVQIPEVINRMQPVAESYESPTKDGMTKPITIESENISNVISIMEPETERQLHVTNPITEGVSHSKTVSFQSASIKETDDVVHIKPYHKIRWKRIKPSPNFSTAEFETKLNGSSLRHETEKTARSDSEETKSDRVTFVKTETPQQYNTKHLNKDFIKEKSQHYHNNDTIQAKPEEKATLHENSRRLYKYPNLTKHEPKLVETISPLTVNVVSKPCLVETGKTSAFVEPTEHTPQFISTMQPVAELQMPVPSKEVHIFEDVTAVPLRVAAKPVAVEYMRMAEVVSPIKSETRAQYIAGPVSEEVLVSDNEPVLPAVVNVKPEHEIRWYRNSKPILTQDEAIDTKNQVEELSSTNKIVRVESAPTTNKYRKVDNTSQVPLNSPPKTIETIVTSEQITKLPPHREMLRLESAEMKSVISTTQAPDPDINHPETYFRIPLKSARKQAEPLFKPTDQQSVTYMEQVKTSTNPHYTEHKQNIITSAPKFISAEFIRRPSFEEIYSNKVSAVPLRMVPKQAIEQVFKPPSTYQKRVTYTEEVTTPTRAQYTEYHRHHHDTTSLSNSPTGEFKLKINDSPVPLRRVPQQVPVETESKLVNFAEAETPYKYHLEHMYKQFVDKKPKYYHNNNIIQVKPEKKITFYEKSRHIERTINDVETISPDTRRVASKPLMETISEKPTNVVEPTEAIKVKTMTSLPVTKSDGYINKLLIIRQINPTEVILQESDSPSKYFRQDFACEPGIHAYYSVAKNCDKFVECKHDVPKLYKCPPGLHFDRKAVWPSAPCGYPSIVGCDTSIFMPTALPKPEPFIIDIQLIGYSCGTPNGYHKVEDNCQQFVQCKQFVPSLYECPSGYQYNNNTPFGDDPCDVPSVAECTVKKSSATKIWKPLMEFVCPSSYGYFKFANDCEKFIKCENYVPSMYKCKNGFHFHRNILWGADPCAAPAVAGCEPHYRKSLHGPFEREALCPRPEGRFPLDTTECSKYVVCANGFATIMPCPPGLAFNAALEVCDWPVNEPSCNPNIFHGFQCPAPVSDKEGDFSSQEITHFRYSDSCQNYIACQNGRPRLLSCDPGLYFDEQTSHCVDSSLVNNCRNSQDL